MKKKTIFISGSSRGIGFEIAHLLSKNKNYNIIINSRSLKKLKFAAKKIKNCKYIAGDITNQKDLKKIYKKLKKIDVLICNVGNSSSVIAGKEKKEDWDKSFKENFFSSVNLIKILEKKLMKTKGMIICISSICGVEYIKGAPITYSVAKSALNHYVKCISKPLGKNNIRINAIASGNIYFKGSVWEKKLIDNPSAVRRMLKNNVSLGKFGKTDDIANLVLFLASSRTSFVTGGIFIADGGQIH